MRSGKSRAVIDVGCYQFKRRKIKGCIIVAPNGVHLNWARNEIPTWCSTEFTNPTFAWETPKRGFPEKEREWEQFLGAEGMRVDVHQHGGAGHIPTVCGPSSASRSPATTIFFLRDQRGPPLRPLRIEAHAQGAQPVLSRGLRAHRDGHADHSPGRCTHSRSTKYSRRARLATAGTRHSNITTPTASPTARRACSSARSSSATRTCMS